jgi:hypothetical protein
MAATIDLQGLMNRIVALEIEGMAALTTPVTCDAVPYFFHQQEGVPYWINRLGNYSFLAADEWGEEVDAFVYPVTARLVIGHISGGYKGENDSNLQLYVPQMVEWFNEHENLHTATTGLTTSLDHLIRCRTEAGIAFGIFENRATGTPQVGAEFNLEAYFVYEIVQQYQR